MSIASNLKPIGEICVYLLISCALWFSWNYFNSAKQKHVLSEVQRDKLSDTSAHGTSPAELETDSTPAPPSAPRPEPPVILQALEADDKLFADIHYDIEETERAILKGIGSKPYLIKVAKVRAGRWKKAARQEYVFAQHSLGRCYLDGVGITKNPAQALTWFQKAAAQNLAEAQYDLGLCQLQGNGTRKDPESAVHLFRAAADQELKDALYQLGI